MQKTAAFLTVHGMGRTEPDYNLQVVGDLQKRLGAAFGQLHIGSVYYQKLLQGNEDRIWLAVSKRTRWHDLRKFLLFGFGDAAGLENGKEFFNSCYEITQILIARELYRARQAMASDGPVLILAQSLGCQVISNYFWDATREENQQVASVGIWRNIDNFQEQITGGPPLTSDDVAFLRGRTVKSLVTTGSNIPIFVAAHALAEILPIHPNAAFTWHNYYDKDDVLGWPLADLSEQYGRAVTDHTINATQGFAGWLLKSWNPLAHTQYWSDGDVLDKLERDLKNLLQQSTSPWATSKVAIAVTSPL